MYSEKSHLYCPSCRNRRLYPATREQVDLDVCLKCGGLWLDHRELELVLRRYDPQMRFQSNFLNTFTQQSEDGSRICPKCRMAMVSYMVKEPVRLDMDVCETCNGIWLDRGELEQAQIMREAPAAIKNIETELSMDHWLLQFFLGLPLEFNVRPRTFPVVTLSLVFLNTIIFLYEIITPRLIGNVGYFQEIVYTWGLVPDSIGSLPWMLNLFSYQFLHGNVYHLFGNMYLLYIVGDNLEDALGRSRFLLFYIICGIGGGIMESAFSPSSQIPIIGASGAITGVMTAYAVIFRRSYLTFMFSFWQWKLPAYLYIGLGIILDLLGALTGESGVAWFAHIGGFLTGLTIVLLIYNWVLERNPLIKYVNTYKNETVR